MNIESKFNLNDKVYPVERSRKTEREKCMKCDGLRGTKWPDGSWERCGSCYGNGYIDKLSGVLWLVGDILTIGQIQIKIESIKKTGIFDNIGEYDADNVLIEEKVMCYETGIGSGTVHPMDKMFATQDEAQNECNRLNEEES